MDDSEVSRAFWQAKTSCQDCYKLSRTRLPMGTVAVSPTREQLMESALGSLQTVLHNGNGCSDEAAHAIARCRRCDYDNPQGPLIFEYLRKQMM